MLGLQLLEVQVAPDSSPAEAPRRPATSSSLSKGFLLLVFEGNFGDVTTPHGWRVRYLPPIQEADEDSPCLHVTQFWEHLGLQRACQRNDINVRKDKR